MYQVTLKSSAQNKILSQYDFDSFRAACDHAADLIERNTNCEDWEDAQRRFDFTNYVDLGDVRVDLEALATTEAAE